MSEESDREQGGEQDVSFIVCVFQQHRASSARSPQAVKAFLGHGSTRLHYKRTNRTFALSSFAGVPGGEADMLTESEGVTRALLSVAAAVVGLFNAEATEPAGHTRRRGTECGGG